MLNEFLALPRAYKRILSTSSDILALSVSVWAAYALRLEQGTWLPDKTQMLAAGFTILFTIAVFIKLGLYRAVIRYLSDKAFLTIIYGVLASCLAFIVFGYLFQAFVPRSVPVIYGALAFVFVSGSRLGVRMVVNRPKERRKEPVAIVGVGETGMQLASALKHGTEYRPEFFISIHKANHRTTVDGLPVLSIEHVARGVQKYRVERILLALDHEAGEERSRLLSSLETVSIPVQTVPSVSELVSGRARISDIRDLEIGDLLGRPPVGTDVETSLDTLYRKVVMVTGAGGSIGSELCRQIIRQKPSQLILFERSEYALYSIERELSAINTAERLGVRLEPLLGSVTEANRCCLAMRKFGVQTVFHAAAYKHVPLVEHNVIEGIENNVFGTLNVAEAAIDAGVERFVLISTDKAVRPTNIMGASKRLAELILQALAKRQRSTVFSMVRFGNVLGSSGSVVPLFRDQIRDGGPVTVTHPEITRYFMTIPEASHLVLQACSMGKGGEVFVLDVGKPVKIADLAKKMIHLMGFTERTEDQPHGEIEISYTGLRPGEKLYEELLIGNNPLPSDHPRILMASEICLDWGELSPLLARLHDCGKAFDTAGAIEILHTAPLGFTQNQIYPASSSLSFEAPADP